MRYTNMRYRCPSTKTHCPAPGEVGPGPDYKAECPVCGKRVSVTKGGLYWPHLRQRESMAPVAIASRVLRAEGLLAVGDFVAFLETKGYVRRVLRGHFAEWRARV